MKFFNPVFLRSCTQLIILCGIFLTALNSHAAEVVKTSWLHSLEFSSEHEALTALSQSFLADSIREDAEHMGAILETEDGRILVTHGKAAPGQTQVEFSIGRLKTTKIIALWHTHGAPGRRTERFSITDGETVRATGLPFYLISPRGQISVLELAKTKGSSVRDTVDASRRHKVLRVNTDLALYRVQ